MVWMREAITQQDVAGHLHRFLMQDNGEVCHQKEQQAKNWHKVAYRVWFSKESIATTSYPAAQNRTSFSLFPFLCPSIPEV
jgi:hypothetical protein